MNDTRHILVGCHNNHAYTVAIPADAPPPRYCAFCKPPDKTDVKGRARSQHVNGGIYIALWRPETVEDTRRPEPFPEPALA